eukprot:SAG22_NODE_113_length_19407_cov_214.925161_14_plen_68_part_00
MASIAVKALAKVFGFDGPGLYKPRSYQHAKMAFKQSDKFSIINYRYTHPSKHAVDGLGSSAYQAIEL